MLADTRSRMMMAITFSRQNDAGAREQYSVLRESPTRSRARPGNSVIFCGLSMSLHLKRVFNKSHR